MRIIARVNRPRIPRGVAEGFANDGDDGHYHPLTWFGSRPTP